MVKKENQFKQWFNRLFGKNAHNRAFHICNYLFFTVFAFVMFYPFLYVVLESLKQNRLINGIAVEEWGISAYASVMKNKALWMAFGTTIWTVVVGTIASVLFTFITSYPLSRSHFRGRNAITFFFFFTTLFSGGLIPYYLLIRDLGLRDSYLVYLIPGLIGGYNIILMKNFLQGLPSELEESAKIDGANNFVIMFGIYFPLSGPILATVALWTAVGRWNNYMTGLLYIKDTSKLLIQNVLRSMIVTASNTGGGVDADIMNMAESVKMASVVIGTLPIIIVYPFVAKYFTKGVLTGSVKG
ncbi:MAG: carbohydrate ABC transporter permease [Clostridia bacterium]|nr:carbohydrate ABC transporter permease [Clostridia bacterium]